MAAAAGRDPVRSADAAAADELRERIGRAVNVSRLFGLGLRLGRPTDRCGTRCADAVLLAANAALCAYGFAYVSRSVRERMSRMWDLTTVMTVVKVYAYLLSPVVTLAAWQWHGAAVVRAARAVHADGVRAVPLRPYARRAAAWYALSVLTESAAYTVFHASTAFAFFSPHEYAMIAVYNVWTVVPVHAYATLADATRLAVRRVNARAAAAGSSWRALRDPWKRLSRAAVGLARHEFGLVIVAFVVRTIAEVVFYVFSVFIVSFPFPYALILRTAVNVSITVFDTVRMFETFRVTHECKQEILKTQRILSCVTFKTKSDYKEFQYFSLYMLHVDLNFMPCGIFEISYRNFVTISTLVTAFAVFQIQMKLH